MAIGNKHLIAGALAALCLLSRAAAQDAPAPASGGGDSALSSLPAECQNLDPSTLLGGGFNLGVAAQILPCTGWDSTCQSAVTGAGASCIQEMQAITQWANSSGIMNAVSALTGVTPDDAAKIAAGGAESAANQTAAIGASITPDMVQSLVTQYTPDIKKALGDCCGGQISASCCSQMAPIVDGKCLCQKTPIDLLETFIGQDPSNFLSIGMLCTPASDEAVTQTPPNNRTHARITPPNSMAYTHRRRSLIARTHAFTHAAKTLLDNLGCTALDKAEIYPNCS